VSAAGEGLQIDCPGIPTDRNLITRALDSIKEETGWRLRGSINVRKRIPVGAGLGGGSSDAACALRIGAEVVAAAGGPALARDTLGRLALGLGADVPFFLDPETAMATGVGEVLEPLELPPLPVVLLLPQAPLFTAEVYQTYDGVAARESAEAWHERRQAAEAAWRNVSAGWASSRQEPDAVCQQVAGLLYNDLERAAFHLLPELTPLKALMEREGVLGVLLSGSGPTLFGVCVSSEEAERAAGRLRSRGLPAQACLAGKAPSPGSRRLP
jgi:4-diphosphocytidyl-2-C-methyl-D-erythritol kinase